MEAQSFDTPIARRGGGVNRGGGAGGVGLGAAGLFFVDRGLGGGGHVAGLCG